jgi:hypothetical protein
MATDPTPESEWLRAHWNQEALGRYDRQWIAVAGPGIIDSSTELEALLQRNADKQPLYAFVHLGPLQR